MLTVKAVLLPELGNESVPIFRCLFIGGSVGTFDLDGAFCNVIFQHDTAPECLDVDSKEAGAFRRTAKEKESSFHVIEAILHFFTHRLQVVAGNGSNKR